MSKKVETWLRELGLGQYASAFVENDIEWELIPELDHETLKDVGVDSVGHRLQLLKAARSSAPDGGLKRPSGKEAIGTSRIPVPHGQAERRQLTVAFCDLVGSTELSLSLDPEDLSEVHRAYQEASKASIEDFGGYLARYMGDGVLAYFGYPHAHENDAERAIRAGLGLIEKMGALNERFQQLLGRAELSVRVGIATGRVVVGDHIGEGASQESVVVGETPNLAARLQSLAKPNTVLISNETYQLIGMDFECEEIGYRNVKGYKDSLCAWAVLHEKTVGSFFKARIRSALTPLVGREEEIQLVLRRWDRASAGEGHVVLISGEPGIGKSRLVEEVRTQTRDVCSDLQYQCSPFHANSALYPIATQMELTANLSSNDSPREKVEKLRSHIVQPNDTKEEDVRSFARLLSIPIDGETASSSKNSQQERLKIMAAFLRQVVAHCAREPVLCIFEDLHWIDPSTLELLDRVVERAQNLPILLLATFRPEFTASWIGAPHVTLISLSRMNAKECAALVAQSAQGERLPESVVSQIVTKTDGVPLFVEELTRTVLEAASFDRAGKEEIDESAAMALMIPTTLQDSLMARLDNLPVQAREVAQLGSTIGREFSHQMLAAIAEWNEAELNEALECLTQSGMLFRHGDDLLSTYTFKHALLQDAAYESLLKKTRQDLHKRIAAVFEKKFPHIREASPEVLAQHYARAGAAEAALGYWERATERALSRSAYHEAISHAREALLTLEQLPPSPDRQKVNVDLHFALGVGLRAVRGFNSKATRDQFIRTKQYSEHIGNRSKVLASLRGVYNHHFTRGEHKQCKRVVDEFQQIVGSSKDPEEIGALHLTAGSNSFYRGELEQALERYEHALRIFRPSGQYDQTFHVLHPRTATLMNLCWIRWSQGFPSHAIRLGDEAIVYTRNSSQPFALVAALAWVCGMRTCCGQIVEIRDLVGEMIATAEEFSIAVWRDRGAFLRGKLDAVEGNLAQGVRRMTEAMNEIRKTGGCLAWTWMASELTVELMRLNQVAEAYQVVDDGLSFAEHNEERNWEAELNRLRGELDLRAGNDSATAAEDRLRRALTIAQRQQSRSLELRAAMSLAKLWGNQGKSKEAYRLLAPILEWFTEGLDTADLEAARLLLGELT